MSNKHLSGRDVVLKGAADGDAFFIREMPAGLVVTVTMNVAGHMTGTCIPWSKIRAALRRKDKPDLRRSRRSAKRKDKK